MVAVAAMVHEEAEREAVYQVGRRTVGERRVKGEKKRHRNDVGGEEEKWRVTRGAERRTFRYEVIFIC